MRCFTFIQYLYYLIQKTYGLNGRSVFLLKSYILFPTSEVQNIHVIGSENNYSTNNSFEICHTQPLPNLKTDDVTLRILFISNLKFPF